jgi:hypothetical protein
MLTQIILLRMQDFEVKKISTLTSLQQTKDECARKDHVLCRK